MAEQRPAETKFATCRVCGSAETVETGTQKCPGCGAPYTEPLSSNPRLEMRQRMLADEERSDEDFERLARLISLEAHEDRLKLWEDVERLTAELDKMRQLDESHWLCRRELAQNRDMWQQRHDRLRANQAEAVRILSAIEFDGQAYAAIQRACKLLAGAAEVNAALNIGQETGHAKRTADETTRCQHGRELAGCIECYRAELNGEASLP